MQRIEQIVGIRAPRPRRVGLVALVVSAVFAAGSTGLAFAAAQEAPPQHSVGEELEAAGNALKAAVLAGELSEEQAWAEWYATRDAIINAAVARGALSNAEASELLRDVHQAELSERLEAAGNDLKAAVARGELAEKQAWAQWRETRTVLIQDTLDAGEISGEVAERYRAELRRDALGQQLESLANELRTAVRAGDMTEDEGWATWYERKHRLINDALDTGEITLDDAEAIRQDVFKDEMDERLSGTGARLKAAVADGELTEQEAWAAWMEAQLAYVQNAADSGEISKEFAAEFYRFFEQSLAGARLKQAVANGELTEAEARAEWERLEASWDEAARQARGAQVEELDARVVLRALRRVRLSAEQRQEVRAIERRVGREYRRLDRRDKPAHTRLAISLKAEFEALLDAEQRERFATALERLQDHARHAEPRPK